MDKTKRAMNVPGDGSESTSNATKAVDHGSVATVFDSIGTHVL